MGIFGSFAKLTQAAVNVALLSVDVAKDVFGTEFTDRSAVERRAGKIERKLDEAYEETFDSTVTIVFD